MTTFLSRARLALRATRPAASVALTLALVALAARSDGAPDDPADRGLDAYIEAPRDGIVGRTIAIDVRTFGFRTTVKPEPIGKVTVDAAWSEGDPTPVSIVTDDAGLGQLVLTVPSGETEEVKLVIGLTHGAHRRTRELTVRRVPRHRLDVRLPSNRVTPGTKLPMWIGVVDVGTGALAPNVPVSVTLDEGGVVQRSLHLVSNAEGAVSVSVDIPETEHPTLDWRLRAAIEEPFGARNEVSLQQFAYVPSKPRLDVHVDARRLPAGGATVGRVKLRDAANEPIEGATVKWVTATADALQKAPPSWEKAASVVTGADGDASIPIEIPAVGFAKEKVLAVMVEVDGRAIEARDRVIVVAKDAPSITATPEDGALVPGIRQRIELRVRDGWDKPVSSDFHVTGDGLDADVHTDARGVGEVAWDAPVDVGAARAIGPCAGDVAATITIKAGASAPKELIEQGGVPVCVPVDRARGARLELASSVGRAGDPLAFKLLFAKPPKPGKDDPPREKDLETWPFSVSVGSSDPGPALAWFTSPEGSIPMPETGGGVFRVTATIPRSEGPALQAVTKVLVKPKILPKLTAKVTGGRLAPGGEVEIEARLVDENGKPLAGSVTAVVNDKLAATDDVGEGVPAAFDVRLSLCEEAGIAAEDCDAALAGDPAQAVNLRASMSVGGTVVRVANDPGGAAKREMLETFRTMLMNLEGAVYQSASDPARLRDVLRAGAKGNEFNPEILTLVTNVLAEPPTTPGGAPFLLEDLVAIDPQVTYDNVARRVTRLKLFRMLEQVRGFRQERAFDAAEPVLGDPNGILRRLFAPGADGASDVSQLMDPWGGSMQFVKGTASGLPFIEPVPGWTLHAPGPDGKLGTADDVSDPFQRVLKSGTPYANAMGEDRVVDARLDMQVADATVQSWSGVLTSFTGTELSTGQGFGTGSGSGRLGGSHRSKPPQIRMGATRVSGGDPVYELAIPVRTDADGVARLKLPLGADETTYRVLVLATADGAGRAAAATDVATTLPLSVRVDGGDGWIVGDEIAAAVKVTNRTGDAMHAKVRLEASGAAALDAKDAGVREVDVPAHRAVWVSLGVRGASEGDGILVASVEGGGLSDRVEHHVAVRPPGKHVVLGRSRWVSRPIEIENFTADARTTLESAPTLVIDPDLSDVIEGALPSLGPDGVRTPDGAIDSLEGLERARRYAATDEPAVAQRASTLRDRVLGRFIALQSDDRDEARYAGLVRRARALLPTRENAADPLLALDAPGACPPEDTQSLQQRIREIEGEPISSNGAVDACWDGAAARAQSGVDQYAGRVELARLILAYADRPHRKSSVPDLADRLASWVSLDASGAIKLDAHLTGDRAARAVIYAALVRATTVGWSSKAPADALLGWLIVQRAADGGFGSRLATRSAILALTAAIPAPRERTLKITSLDADGGAIGEARTVKVTRGERVALDAKTARVRIDVDATSDGILVRLEQPALLGWIAKLPADELASPIQLETRWPESMKVGSTAMVEVRLGGTPIERAPMLVRVPLPPGAYLGESVDGVRMVEGAVLVEAAADAKEPGLPILVPIRLGLAGTFTIGEAWAKGTRDDSLHARTPRATIKIAPR